MSILLRSTLFRPVSFIEPAGAEEQRSSRFAKSVRCSAFMLARYSEEVGVKIPGSQ